MVVEEKYSSSSSTTITSNHIEVSGKNISIVGEPSTINETIAFYDSQNEVNQAVLWMGKISPKRAEDYKEWIFIGKCLKSLGQVGLSIWDEWSKKSSTYRSGDCAASWELLIQEMGVSVNCLKKIAEIDSPFDIPKAKKNPLPVDYSHVFEKLGLRFQLNECNDDIIVNGAPMSDILSATILYPLKNHGYNSKENAEIAWKHEASKNKFHPISDYLDGHKWDGNDHIGKLCSFIEDVDGVFPLWIRRWLIGCIAKVMANPRGQQNRMLVLDGKQNIGKSYFVRWLCSPVPAYHIESPINPEDKDSFIRLMSKWIWEVSELGATTRKADREALKHFLSLENVTVRKSYGHYDTEKPALANFIGTVNNDIGFLSDPTGSRRFMSCTLTRMDWVYSKEVDINQLWAQAVVLFRNGEPWNLTKEEVKQSNEINQTYEVENPFTQYISKYFDIDLSRSDWTMQIAEIIDILKNENVGGMDLYSMQRNVTSAMKYLGIKNVQRRTIGHLNPIRVWEGIKRKDINK